MKKKLVFIILCSCLLLSGHDLSAKTLHAIFVADTVHETGFATGPDVRVLLQELRTVAKSTQMVLKEKVFSGPSFQKQHVESYLNHLKVDRTDLVVFFFSGHGYRTQQKTTPWPMLNFEFYKTGMDLKWVAEVIKSKKPQFALVMADCCNNFVERGFVNQSKNIQINLNMVPARPQGYQPLFSKAKGCIVACSSGVGEFSYGSQFGGLFTQCFMVSLRRELNEKNPDWKRLLERATSYIKHIQKPICEISSLEN